MKTKDIKLIHAEEVLASIVEMINAETSLVRRASLEAMLATAEETLAELYKETLTFA